MKIRTVILVCGIFALTGALIDTAFATQRSTQAVCKSRWALKDKGLQGIEWVVLGDHSVGNACG
jgi:hypothetical protein